MGEVVSLDRARLLKKDEVTLHINDNVTHIQIISTGPNKQKYLDETYRETITEGEFDALLLLFKATHPNFTCVDF